MTDDIPEAMPPAPWLPRPVRYWPDGTAVTLDVEEALDRIVETVRRIQAKLQAP
ncbi:hypothetical protein [Streptosporangium sp. 'caverna']|uniref:hypothetical protein n=1 Tax=Streptosporangium sp. 'caverna' TaxID=2202249 RepID=UPI0013A6EB96|nr:hypothetical protein [Streptosporangium sp. 'caverna']